MFFPDDAVRLATLFKSIRCWVAVRACAYAQWRLTFPSCSDGVKSADSIVCKSTAHDSGELQVKEAVILNPC